ncbi:MAG: hypothetical protein RLZZ498_696 [Pseudomonadota bacterium]
MHGLNLSPIAQLPAECKLGLTELKKETLAITKR